MKEGGSPEQPGERPRDPSERPRERPRESGEYGEYGEYGERPGGGHRLVFHVGREELVIRRRYEVLSILNDLLIGVWFAVGSILFFNEDTTRAGTWLFLIGSVQLMIRPAIRLARNVHLQRLGPARNGQPKESSFDF